MIRAALVQDLQGCWKHAAGSSAAHLPSKDRQQLMLRGNAEQASPRMPMRGLKVQRALQWKAGTEGLALCIW